MAFGLAEVLVVALGGAALMPARHALTRCGVLLGRLAARVVGRQVVGADLVVRLVGVARGTVVGGVLHAVAKALQEFGHAGALPGRARS